MVLLQMYYHVLDTEQSHDVMCFEMPDHPDWLKCVYFCNLSVNYMYMYMALTGSELCSTTWTVLCNPSVICSKLCILPQVLYTYIHVYAVCCYIQYMYFFQIVYNMFSSCIWNIHNYQGFIQKGFVRGKGKLHAEKFLEGKLQACIW